MEEPIDTPDGAAPGSLESMAAEAEASLRGAGQQQPGTAVALAPEQPAKRTNTEICTGLFLSVRESVCVIADLESPRRELDDAKCAKLGEIWGQCADHYGLDLSEKMGKWGPLIAAGMATGMHLWPVVTEVRKEIRAKDGGKPPAPPPASGPVAEAPQQPIPPAPADDGVIRPAWPA